MSAPQDRPFQTLGFRTSVELASDQYYDVPQLVGLKRPVDFPLDCSLRPTMQSLPVCLNSRDKNAIRPHSIVGGFTRASIAPASSRLVASEIHSTAVPSPEIRRRRVEMIDGFTSKSCSDPILSLSSPQYGLNPVLVANFASLGVSLIYPWQASCLLAQGILAGQRHLVYTAPTGGGKSLVADVLMLKRVIENPTQKAILVLPYVALVQEKLKWIRRIVENVEKNVSDHNDNEAPRYQKKLQKSIRVTGFFGGSKTVASWADTDIAVCTIEKANSLINTAIEECNIGDLGVVVLDELHMLDDEHRGYILELIVTKLLLLRQDVQIIGMSATISNTEILADWMNAKFYISTYRPVPVEEYLVYDNAIYPTATSRQLLQVVSKLNTTASPAVANTLTPHRIVIPSQFRQLANPMANAMVALAVDTAAAGYGALVFCGSHQACQVQASLICEAMPMPDMVHTDEINKRLDLLADLRSLPNGLDPILEKVIMSGVGFHHAGMTTEERELIAQAYDKNVLKVLVATCTLAAGVNLPARRVIIYGVRMGRELIGPAMLRQMFGRAGRRGKDDAGETFLICGKSDLEDVCCLLEADMPAIESCLAPEKRGLKRALLEAIAVGLASGCDVIKDYVKCTLLYQTAGKKVAYSIMNSALLELAREGLLRLADNRSYEATRLGKAIVASSFAPEDGLFIHEELMRALQAFVMDSDMHVFYMFTPLQVVKSLKIDWQIFRDQLDNLDESGIRALQFVGIQPGFVNMMVQSGAMLREDTPEKAKQAKIYCRAYSAFQLRDIASEVPLSTIAARYHIPRGTVQALAQQCHGFAAGIIKFCQHMDWGMLGAVLDHMRDRLEAGARSDLLEMTQVTHVKSWTARLLRDNGFRNLRTLAQAEPKDLVPVLMMANPRGAQKIQTHATEAERYSKKLLKKAEVIVTSANKIWEREMQIELDD